MELPKCQKCNNGTLIPLSNNGQEGASVIFRVWACTNPECGFSLARAEATKTVELVADDGLYAVESAVEELNCTVEALKEQTEEMTEVMTVVVRTLKGGFSLIAVLLLPVVIRACSR
jgi:hypothetical protein